MKKLGCIMWIVFMLFSTSTFAIVNPFQESKEKKHTDMRLNYEVIQIIRFIKRTNWRVTKLEAKQIAIALVKYGHEANVDPRLAAALIAGFIGALTQVIILNVHKLPTNPETLITFMVATFMISALFGFIMKFSKLFPHLVNTYYKKLGVSRSMYTDGISGIIVQATLLLILYLFKFLKIVV